MFEKFCIKQGDLWPPLEANLTQADGTSLELQETDIVKFIMTPKNDRTNIIVDAEANIMDYETAYVYYTWQDGDTDIADHYQGEFLVLLGGTIPLRVPNNGYFYIIIDHKLGSNEDNEN